MNEAVSHEPLDKETRRKYHVLLQGRFKEGRCICCNDPISGGNTKGLCSVCHGGCLAGKAPKYSVKSHRLATEARMRLSTGPAASPFSVATAATVLAAKRETATER